MRTQEEMEMVRIGPGTPSGEVFRRYWLPVEISANLGGGRRDSFVLNPIKVKMLGEDLVLFRDSKGVPHLLEEHCSHRGTSLSYGRSKGIAFDACTMVGCTMGKATWWRCPASPRPADSTRRSSIRRIRASRSPDSSLPIWGHPS